MKNKEKIVIEDLIPLRQYCKNNAWPRLPQWNHWITANHPIAQQCIKKIAGRYLINIPAFVKYINNCNMEGGQDE